MLYAKSQLVDSSSGAKGAVMGVTFTMFRNGSLKIQSMDTVLPVPLDVDILASTILQIDRVADFASRLRSNQGLRDVE